MADNQEKQSDKKSESAAAGTERPAPQDSAAPVASVSSEALASAETSVGKGAVAGENDTQENKEADPNTLH
ncbi:hypothetical protein [Hymenobacter jejuensis]|uniref:Uncharacterized protein n=1 Tax=Hymenobacter jejuensis TaxID=2502781 RepID=A0A5B8A0V5_9BACT|nr:hypothetical protein [Hymenobacter jejuensis]QDA60898.1 hypothetical protein FHG12_12635 [Hymenobacter jejuensis]